LTQAKKRTPAVPVAQRPRRLDGLDITAVEDGFMVYRPDVDRVHYLNHIAVLILELCNGKNTHARMATLLKQAYGLSKLPESEVSETLRKLTEQGLVRRGNPRTAPSTSLQPRRKREAPAKGRR
jgi:hypothetical protein